MTSLRTLGRQAASVVQTGAPLPGAEPGTRPSRRSLRTVTTPAVTASVIVGVLGFFMPAVLGTGNLMTVLVNGIVLGLGALSVGFLLNTLGWVSFGGAAFSGAAAYVFAVVVSSKPELSVQLAILIAVLGSTMISVLVGLVFVRSRALVFTMLTLALGQLLLQVVDLHSLSDRTGGTNGLVASFSGTLFGLDASRLNAAETFWPIAWACVVVAVFLSWLITRSAFGRVLRGIRENESRLQHAGFGTYWPKLAAFAFAGFLGAVSGVLQAINMSFVSPDLFSFATSGTVIIAVIIGGYESPWGPVVGAIVLTELENQFASSGELFLYMGIAVIVVLVLFPRGISGLVGVAIDRVKVRRERHHLRSTGSPVPTNPSQSV